MREMIGRLLGGSGMVIYTKAVCFNSIKRGQNMKKTTVTALMAATALAVSACGSRPQPAETTAGPAETAPADTETLTGKGDGYGGEITVVLTRENGRITDVKITGDKETDGVGTPAIEQLPEKILAANGPDVDAIAGATLTSKGIIYAVKNALDPAANPYPAQAEAEPDKDPAALKAASVYQGFGLHNSGRFGPGKDDQDVPVYSVNQVAANVLFDQDGRILALYVDQIEYATPNYDGETMPHFSGFPGQGGYNLDENHDGKVDGVSDDSEDNFTSEVGGWKTKRERGSSYKMGNGTWASQMDNYQELFVGMTVAEVNDWYARYCSDVNGRPLKADSSNEEDVKKFQALAADEQEMLADVISGATMSLNDPHGNIVAAIGQAFDHKKPLDVKAAAGMGIGIASNARLGPGKDAEEVPVYSVNQVFANTIFDENGKIAAVSIDQLEFSTPNYDGDGMPHFSGFPGQKAYNYDEQHDQKLVKREPGEETFISDIEGWKTKRERGDSYRMGTGTWASQMDKFQEIFVGMTAAEAEQWFEKYCSDINGRPLKEDSSNPEDVTKFKALSKEDQEMLVDVVSGATMSLNDSHGDIIAALRLSFENRQKIDIKVD